MYNNLKLTDALIVAFIFLFMLNLMISFGVWWSVIIPYFIYAVIVTILSAFRNDTELDLLWELLR